MRIFADLATAPSNVLAGRFAYSNACGTSATQGTLGEIRLLPMKIGVEECALNRAFPKFCRERAVCRLVLKEEEKAGER